MTKKKETKEVVVDDKTKNPLNKGVSYSDFMANVKGNVTVKSLLDKLDIDEPTKEWLKNELQNYKNK